MGASATTAAAFLNSVPRAHSSHGRLPGPRASVPLPPRAARPLRSSSAPFPASRGVGLTSGGRAPRGERTGGRMAVAVRAGILEECANTEIPSLEGGRAVKAHVARPAAPGGGDRGLPVVILLHEFWGVAPEMCGKGQALADELGVVVVTPDTFRGASTRMVPKAIYLALSTPQERVNEDLDDVAEWCRGQGWDTSRLGVVGFCYGGGKGIRWAAHHGGVGATAVLYGKPVSTPGELEGVAGPVLGIFGTKDAQFPAPMVEAFRSFLEAAGIEHTVSLYEGEGHAFWRDMDQVRDNPSGPQARAWRELTGFLRRALQL